MDPRDQLIRYFIETYNKGLNTLMGGNASIRIGDSVLITPSGVPKSELTINDIVELSINGNVIEGNRKPSSEWRMHLSIYRVSDYKAVIHAHAPSIITLYLAGLSLDLSVVSEAKSYIRKISDVEFIKPGTQELADEVSMRIKDGADLIVLKNHGVVAVGYSLPEALNKIEVAEDTAKMLLTLRLINKY
ncbi:class II aldolase/adducin family protein [Caldivirga maquilingensis]|uniref:Class II aldolase/adducin family protein n=1 Tax=Caldivirga maquilingensis (strain ATCC 700844 / DSM 13496 / JCM 10307 / IC-167) TaxID=397948 RepID=A8MAE3_CALMQ|nr:class II aldolase/adducin family protein [Caldivirga maquilingensis]ABW02520.1 class II aldolase/adducin family protein [Caldivirga maquilingensis IC-167]